MIPTARDEDAFDRAWREVEQLGGCDGLGGAEYERVRAEYEQCRGDVPGDEIASFIHLRANVGPTELRSAREHWNAR